MRTLADHNAASAKKGVLTATQVLKIKEALGRGENPRALAVIYGVSVLTITRIRNGDTWAWLKPQGGGEGPTPHPQMPEDVATSLAALQKLMEEEKGAGGLETLNRQAEEVLRADMLAEELTGRKIERRG